MKLLHVVAGMDPKLGGVSQAIRTIILNFDKVEWHHEVVCLDSKDASYLNNDSFTIHAVGPGQGPWGYSSKLMIWLKENLPRFDVVILHGLWLFPGFAVRRALHQLKKNLNKINRLPRLFIMPHGMLDPYFQRTPERKLKAFRNWLYWKLLEHKVVNQAEGLLFTCEEERVLAKESFQPYNPKQEIVVGLGVEEPPAFTSNMEAAFLEKCPSVAGKPYFLFLSRIHEKKGVDLLIRAYQQMWARKSQGKFFREVEVAETEKNVVEETNKEVPMLVIAGPGLDTPFGKKVLALVSESGVPEGSILFPGMLSGEAKWGAFYGCEAFILPSHQENFGIAIVEALACGKPVLITNKVNIWREINAFKSGIVADDTQKEINKLLKDWNTLPEKEKLNFKKQALNAFQQHFAIKASISKWIDALK